MSSFITALCRHIMSLSIFSKHPLVVCLISGAFFGVSWPGIGFWPFALLCPGILLLCLVNLDKQICFLSSAVFFTSAWTVAFHWNALHPNTVTALSSVVALLTMISIQSGLIALFSSPVRKISPLTAALCGVLGIAVWDWIMLHGPLAMPGTMLGLSVSDSILADEWVPLVGSYGLTLIVLAFNLGWVIALRSVKHRSWGLALLVVLALFPLSWSPELSAPSEVISITAIQPGMSPTEWAEVTSTTKESTLFAMLDSAKTAFAQTQLFVLPETSLPISSSLDIQGIVKNWSDSLGASVISGAIVFDSIGTFYNSAVASSGSGQFSEYHKRRLVPFVETVPLARFLPFSEKFRLESGGVSSYGAGTEWALLNLGQFKVGLLICFESFFPSDAAYLRSIGANLLVVITQDGWWQSETARLQHEAYTRLLALAAGLPVVQSSVDGVSAIWNANGTLMAKGQTNGYEMIHADLSLQSLTTQYSKTGDYPSNVLLSILLMVYLGFIIRIHFFL